MILPDDTETSLFKKLEAKLFENRIIATTLLLGLLLVGFGLFLFRSGVFEGTKVEILEDSGGGVRLSEDGEPRQVTVEIAGAVEKPGVYQLLASERVERLLIEAGGLSAEADREWVEKNLNRAAKLVDGQKIYVPRIGEVGSGGYGGVGGGKIAGSSLALVNLNTASASELESLWGIGEARAKAIIDNRPYASSQELLSKKVVPQNVYDKIKNEITAP